MAPHVFMAVLIPIDYLSRDGKPTATDQVGGS